MALKYLPLIASCNDFVNADEIAKGLSPLNFEAGQLQAGKIFLEILKDKIEQRNDFAFETTLSGRAYLSKIDEWRQLGWKVHLIYLYIPNVEFSAMRVQQRVMHGGHNIPIDDINRRYLRSIRNLFDYADVCDYTLCLDNTGTEIFAIFEKQFGHPMKIYNKERFEMLRGALADEQ